MCFTMYGELGYRLESRLIVPSWNFLQLAAKTEEFRQRLGNGETLADIQSGKSRVYFHKPQV